MSIENRKILHKGIQIRGDVTLKGTLTIPDAEFQKYPAVIIVPGSGEIDRDGTISALKIEINIYKDLAEMITALGFITLRYDKRGVGKSSGALNEAGMWDLVDDVARCIDFLQSHPQVDKNNIILLGHSEGCTLSTAVFQRRPVQGLVLLAGAAEPLADASRRQRQVIYDQLMSAKGMRGFIYRLKSIDKKGEKQAEKLRGKVLNTNEDSLKYNGEMINAKWLREHYQYNLNEDLSKINCPVFAATGTKDFQADPEKLNVLTGLVRGNVEAHTIEYMDHSLKEFTGSMDALEFQKNYEENADKPIHKELQKNLSNWLIKYFK